MPKKEIKEGIALITITLALCVSATIAIYSQKKDDINKQNPGLMLLEFAALCIGITLFVIGSKEAYSFFRNYQAKKDRLYTPFWTTHPHERLQESDNENDNDNEDGIILWPEPTINLTDVVGHSKS